MFHSIERLSPARLIFLSGIIFAIVHSLVKYLHRIPVSEVSLFRASISLLVTFLILRSLKRRSWGSNKPLLIARGVAGTIAMVCYFFTLQKIPLATAVTLQYLYPLFSVLIALLVFKEKPSLTQWLCIAAAFYGVFLMNGFNSQVDLFYIGIGTFSALCVAAAIAFIKATQKSEDPLIVVLYFPLVAIPLVAPFAYFQWVPPTLLESTLLLIIGILTQFAQYLLTIAYQKGKTSNIATINYLGVIYALLIGWLFFAETISVVQIIGIVIIMTAIFVSHHQTKKS